MLRKALPITILVLALLVPAAPAGSGAQSSIALPVEFRPEGIASGKGDSFYVGSIPLGAVYRGSYRTGEGSVLVPPHPGRNHTGLKVDTRFDRLFVAGGASKAIYVYDSKTGDDVASFTLPDAGFVNDVVLTRNAAYFTDSLVPQLYRVGHPPQRRADRAAAGQVLAAISSSRRGFNVNGIDTLEGGQPPRRRQEQQRRTLPGQRPQRLHARDRARQDGHERRRHPPSGRHALRRPEPAQPGRGGQARRR